MVGTVDEYLALIDEPRRAYGRAYVQWLLAGDGSKPPQPEGIRTQTAYTMRRRIDEMSKGREFHPLEAPIS